MTTVQDLEVTGPEPDESEPVEPVSASPAVAGQGVAGDDTVPDAAIGAARRHRGASRRSILFAFLVGALLVAVAAVGSVLAYEQAYAGRVAAGVSVGGVSLAGMTRDEADATLRSAFASVGDGTVAVSTDQGVVAMTYRELGRRLDASSMLDAALSVGRSGSAIERVVEEARTIVRNRDLPLRVLVDPVQLDARVATLATSVNREPISAEVTNTVAGFTASPATAGRAVDQAAMVAAISTALASVDVPDRIEMPLVLQPIPPTVTDEVAAAAAARAGRMVGDVVLTDGTDRWTIAAAAVRPWISFGQTGDGSYGPVLDLPAIEKALDGLVAKVSRKPISATFYVGTGGQVVGVKASVDGRALDVPGTALAIQAALLARADGGPMPPPTIAPVLTVAPPDLTTEQATKAAPLMKAISSWTTYYAAGAHNGNGANISIPARAINGTIVAPGEWFSFWKSVGEVSLAKGYKLGGAIIDGHSVEGKSIGGGICSTSTTIFNAALRAGLQMGARKNHYYYISRYPKGLDATVFISGGSVQDMTWRNDTQFPILIRAYTGIGIVKFTLYSVPTGRKVTFTKPVVKNYLSGTTVTQYTTSLRPGVRSQVEYPADGQDVTVIRTVTDATGKVVHRDTYFSHYARMVGVILIGKKAAAPIPGPTPIPTPIPAPTATPIPTP